MLLLRFDVWKLGLVVPLQEVCCDVPSRDLRIIEGQRGVIDGSPNHLVWIREVVFVMTVGAAESRDCCDGIAAPASATSTLLVVCASGRHIAQRDAREGSDIYTDFHRRGA